MIIGSLFSGIGGLELGLEMAGVGHTAFHVEIDPDCRALLHARWPDALSYEDVRAVGADLPDVDVLCGGFPCQDMSSAGKGAGLQGARSGLWYEFLRIIHAKSPRYVVVENVRGFLRRGLDEVVTGLSDAGYEVEGTRIFAEDVGAPHRRERVFLLAYSRSIPLRQQQQWGSGGREGAIRYERLAVPGDPGYVAHPYVWGRGGFRLSVQGGRDHWATWYYADGLREPGEVESAMGGGPDGVPTGLDIWPSGRFAEQKPWEPPRVIEHYRGRRERLRALGNAVVPQCAYVVGKRILEKEGG